MKSTLFRLIAVALGVLGAGAIGEAALRLGGYSPSYVNPLGSFHESHPLVGYRGKPNFSGRFRTAEFDALIVHDANGFRRQEYQTPLAQSRHRILVFGDSFTWGWGVSQGDEFTDQMSRQLPGYHVMNFGLNASGTLQQAVLFETYGRPLLAPGDTLLLMFFNNDFNDNLTGFLHAELRDGEIRLVGPVKKLRKKSVLKDASYLINAIVYSADRIRIAFKQRRVAQRTTQLVELGTRSPEVVVLTHYLVALRDACAHRQARFVIAYIPGQAELGEAPEVDAARLALEEVYRRTFFEVTQALGIPTIDLLPQFLTIKQTDGVERLTYQRDEHWTPNGHAVAARILSQFILEADQRPR